MADTREQLDVEWAQLRKERDEFEKEKVAFQLERDSSGVEFKLFVGNLDPVSTQEEVEAYFKPYGSLKEVILLLDREGKSKRSAFVLYYSKSAMNAAIVGLHEKVKDKNAELRMAVREAKPKSARQSQPAFTPPPPGRYREQPRYGSAYDPYQAASPQPAYATPYNPYPSHPGRGPPAPPAMRPHMGGAYGQGQSPRGPSSGTGCNLYLNNIDKQATDYEVSSTFSEFGKVVSVKLFAQQGYGFVSFDSPAAAQAAIAALNGMVSADGSRRLEVSLKKEKGNKNTTPRYSPY